GSVYRAKAARLDYVGVKARAAASVSITVIDEDIVADRHVALAGIYLVGWRVFEQIVLSNRCSLPAMQDKALVAPCRRASGPVERVVADIVAVAVGAAIYGPLKVQDRLICDEDIVGDRRIGAGIAALNEPIG